MTGGSMTAEESHIKAGHKFLTKAGRTVTDTIEETVVEGMLNTKKDLFDDGEEEEEGDTSAGFNLSYQGKKTVETHEVTHTNVQMNIKKGVIEVGDTFNMGALDTHTGNGAGEGLAIRAKRVTQEAEEDEKTVKTHKTLTTMKVNVEGHSSIKDVVDRNKKLAKDAKDGKKVDAGQTTAQAIGDATQLANG